MRLRHTGSRNQNRALIFGTRIEMARRLYASEPRSATGCALPRPLHRSPTTDRESVFLRAGGGRCPQFSLHVLCLGNNRGHGLDPPLHVRHPQGILTRCRGERDARLRTAPRPVVADLGANEQRFLLRPLERLSGQANAPVEDLALNQLRLGRARLSGLGRSRFCRTRAFCSRNSVSKSARYCRWAR